jgi:sugar phosphate isomerase/epimerase
MITLSAFADEISRNLPESLAILRARGVACMELRGFDDTNVMKLTDAQVAFARDELAKAGFAVGSIATPIGKVGILDPFEPQEIQMRRAVELAGTLGSKHIRIFSFYIPKGDDPAKHRAAVMDRMGKLLALAAGRGLTVVLENEEGLYGDTIERCADIIDALKVPHLKLAFDPCNLVIIGPRPFTDSYPLALKHLGYMHVKDWVKATKHMVPAGQGDAEWAKILPALKRDGYAGIVALEPHLSAAGQFAGFSGPDLFGKAHEGLVGMLKQAGLEYR